MFYYLRYLTYVASLIDGFIGCITLGFYCPYTSLSANAHFMDWCDNNLTKERSYKQFRK